MAGTYVFNVVAPDGQVLNKEIEFVVVPGENGEIGVLPNHAPLIAGLGIGVIRYTENGKVNKVAISGGFMEVIHNKVTVLANTAETAGNINIQRAEAAKERAEKRLKEWTPDTDLARAEVALKRAIARIKAVS
ncbi:MAG: ATP synthase epsilon chain [Candidatus Dichloromethanomonas elyunquensis]|nr:MAG: ATP synthase epsilon chain [Candidatus Dichloromethanomonas elyunquensis]